MNNKSFYKIALLIGVVLAISACHGPSGPDELPPGPSVTCDTTDGIKSFSGASTSSYEAARAEIFNYCNNYEHGYGSETDSVRWTAQCYFNLTCSSSPPGRFQISPWYACEGYDSTRAWKFVGGGESIVVAQGQATRVCRQTTSNVDCGSLDFSGNRCKQTFP